MRPFKQVDVFSTHRYGGNPVAVVLDSTGLSAQQMQRFAAWTNLSETTFLAPPSHPEADYAIRIFTNTRELPFAGHPTLGSCHAWLEHGGIPKNDGYVIQECEQGLIRVRRGKHPVTQLDTLAFQAPPLSRKGPLPAEELESITAALGLTPDDVVAHSWCINGPEWRGLLLKSAEKVLGVKPNQAKLGDKDVGIIGPRFSIDESGQERTTSIFEVRAFCPLDSPFEDPATGSLNAGLAQWLLARGGRLVEEAISRGGFEVRQGSCVGRNGEILISSETDSDSKDELVVWVGGVCQTCISGQTLFP